MPGIADFYDFRGRAVLITGAATGIGRAVAVAVPSAAHGAGVWIGVVNEGGARETLDLVKQAGGDAVFVPADVSDEADVAHLVDQTVRHFGRLDYAFNNAGIAPKDADRKPTAQLGTAA